MRKNRKNFILIRVVFQCELLDGDVADDGDFVDFVRECDAVCDLSTSGRELLLIAI